jgi:apolipoprotein N-acyltransferase
VRRIHAEMSAVRAVENGMAVFRQTGSGVSMAADAVGREFSRVDSFAASDQAPGEQHVELPLGAVPTLYPAVGAGFAVVTGVGTLVVLGWLLRRAARRPSPPSRRPSNPLAAPLDATRVR